MRTLRQIFAITAMNLRNLPQRVGTSLVVVVGIAGVVGVLVSVLAMSEGFRHTLASTGRGDRVILLRAGSDAELSSGVDRDQATLLAALPGVGREAAGQFAGLAVGSRIAFRDSDWTVVGVFESGGDVHESEIWADAEVAMSAFRRSGYQSVTARLADGSDQGLAALRDTVAREPRFSINVLREPEYYAKQAGVLSNLINVLGYTVASFIAVGATFGALNCMYSAIASRQVEIATLRAIGFGGTPVVVSVVIEALLLALLGGGVGGALAYVYCDGASLSTLNFSTFSQVGFDFQVTPGLLLRGLVWALVIGAAGGLPPAVRSARIPVTEALRTL